MMLQRMILVAPRLLPRGVRGRLAGSRSLSRLLSRALAGSGSSVVAVASGPLRGALLELDVASEKAFWSGTHELRLQEALAGVATAGQVAWDIGAHVGFFSLLLARTCESVVALEPHPGNVRRLRRNVELNRAGVEIVEKAVAGQRGRVDLVIGPLSGTHKLAGVSGPRWRDAAPGDKVMVDAVVLDDLLDGRRPPDLVKLDIEGAELDVLRSGPRVLRHATTVIVETHSAELRRDVSDLLHNAGFRVEEIDGDHLLAAR